MTHRIDLVLVRYDNPTTTYGVHYTTDRDEKNATLCPQENLAEFFDFGNEIEITVEDIWMQIPLEWKSEAITDEWILERVTAYDKITPSDKLRALWQQQREENIAATQERLARGN